MKNRLRSSLQRLERLLQIRQTYVSAAEAGVKQAENEVKRLQAAESETTGNIQHTQAGIAYLQTATGQDIQSGERYIKALQQQRKLIRQSLEKATGNLEQRRTEWTEAKREEKIAEKLQERRLHQWERDDDAAQQKSQDDVSISRYVRTRLEK
jgi:flagellar export protein FliJ